MSEGVQKAQQISEGSSILQILLSPKTTQQKVILCVVVLGTSATGYVLLKRIIRTILGKKKRKDKKEDKKEDKKGSGERKKKGLNKEFFKNLKMLTNITVPKFKSMEVILMSLLVGAQLFSTIVSNKGSRVSGELLRALLDKNLDEFRGYIGMNIGIFALTSFLKPSLEFLENYLSLRWRKKLTENIHNKYYSDMNYYKLAFLDKRIKNPDQCISQDIVHWSESAVDMYMKFIEPLINFIYFTYKLIKSGGIVGPVTTWIYMFISVNIIFMVAPNFGKMIAEKSMLEGDFRKTHTRIRAHAESIAVYNGGLFEKNIVNERFDKLVNHSRKLISAQYRFGMFYDALFKYFPHTIVWVILGFPVYFGQYNHLSIGEVIRELKYISEMVASEFSAVGGLLNVYRNLLNLSGHTERVASIFNVINDIKEKSESTKDLYTGKIVESKNSIKFENVKIVTPANVTLATNMNFEVVVGKNTIITGPNGAGKSSLFRVLGGLWPLHEGTIKKPGSNISGLHQDIFYVPQKPYNCVGTLRDQILYPTPEDHTHSDDKFREVLDLVNLSHLAEDYGFDSIINWSTISLGEQQKLAMARLFFHKPKFAILDECTSGITLKDEKMLYDKCKELKITCITISHRPALYSYHDYVIVFDGSGKHQYTKIDHSNKLVE